MSPRGSVRKDPRRTFSTRFADPVTTTLPETPGFRKGLLFRQERVEQGRGEVDGEAGARGLVERAGWDRLTAYNHCDGDHGGVLQARGAGTRGAGMVGGNARGALGVASRASRRRSVVLRVGGIAISLSPSPDSGPASHPRAGLGSLFCRDYTGAIVSKIVSRPRENSFPRQRSALDGGSTRGLPVAR